MKWTPEQYHKFQSERFAPFEDLMALIERRNGMRVVDLGCGTGELTERIADALAGCTVLGIDSSPEMLAKASPRERDDMTFEQRQIEDVEEEWDLIVSNAALHWVDDHPTLLQRLAGRLRANGQLAVQLPSNHRHLAYTTIRDVAGQPPFREALGGWVRESPVLEVDQYATILYESGLEELVVFEKVYPHVLENADAVAEWVSGTVLLPYFERMDSATNEEFMRRYRERLREQFPESPVFYPFRRTFFSARKPGWS